MARVSGNETPWMAAAARGAAVVFWLVAWQAACAWLAQPLLLPGPLEVARALVDGAFQPAFWSSAAFSAARIGCGLLAAYTLALPAAALAHRLPMARILLAPPLQAVKATPVVCVVVLLLLWFGSANVSFAAVLLMAVPGLYFTTLEGLDRSGSELEELFSVHAVGGARRALACTWQRMLPYVRAASANVVGMAWKAGVAAELIGVPAGSIGERIYQSKLLIETADVLAWTVAVIALSALCERLVLAALSASGPAAIRLAVRLNLRPAGRRGRNAGAQPGSGSISLVGARAPYGAPARPVDLDVPAGCRCCLLAPSGYGKTTVLRLVAGLVAQPDGRGRAPRGRAALFQESRLIEDASAMQNIALFARPGTGAGAIASLLGELASEVDPAAPVRGLSGGQRRRVELLRALLAPGDAVLLDEPFAGLDEESHERAARLVDRLLDGRTLLVATHDRRDAELLGATAVFLS